MITDLRECFIEWFGNNIDFFQCSDGGIRISIPIVDEYNDDICVYMYKQNGSFRLTDKGEAYRSLRKAGILLSENNLDYIMSSTISRFGAIYVDMEKALVSEGAMDTLPDAVMFLSQAVSALENIKKGKAGSKTRVPSFSHKLESLFKAKGYHYANNPKFRGSRGLEHSFDYKVASRDKDNSVLLSVLPAQGVHPKFSLLYEWADVRGYSVPDDSYIIAIEKGIKRIWRESPADPEILKVNNEMYRNNIVLVGSDEYENALTELVG